MNSAKTLFWLKAFGAAFMACSALTSSAQQFRVIYSFGNGLSGGAFPYAGVTFDSSGNLYGTTRSGGMPCLVNDHGCGVVFQLMPDGQGGSMETVLHDFNGSDGGLPTAPVVFDRHGNLFTTSNCPQDCFFGFNGDAVELAPAQGSWTETVLHNFMENGCSPDYFGTGGVIVCSVGLDPAGRLFGQTVAGGASTEHCSLGCGQVFLLGQVSALSRYYLVIHNFADGTSDGRFPQGLLAFDAAGNIYGTTGAGGAANHGVVYMLTPNHRSFGRRETILHSFQGGDADGENPIAGVVLDAAGNVYGTTSHGGTAGQGTVFMLSPQPDGSWSETVLYSFLGTPDAGTPNSSLTFDAAGNLYGTAGGGSLGAGTVFKLSPSSGGHWTETVLRSFSGEITGGSPYGGVTIDSAGNIFGTASQGGNLLAGEVWEITP